MTKQPILKIALSGYGKMGKMLMEAAPRFDAKIVAIIDPHVAEAKREITAENLCGADVCIDFSHPDAVFSNIQKAAGAGINLVVGTTGWNHALARVKDIVLEHGIGLVYGANFSIGMNLFFRMVENAAKEFNRFPEYDIYGYELHHRQKADSPSGTAIALSEILLDQSERKSNIIYDRVNRKIGEDELHFASIRAGFIPGTHTVGFDSEADTIELVHRIRNRSCLAIGALKAAQWIQNRKGMYSFQEIITEILC